MSEYENLSRELSWLLDMLGYNSGIVEERRDAMKSAEFIVNFMSAQLYDVDVSVCITGSKREGLTSVRESDVDFLLFLEDIVCVEQSYQDEPNLDDKIIFTMDTEQCSPGYTLLFHRSGEMAEHIQEKCTQKIGTKLCFSSKLFLKYFHDNFKQNSENPAISPDLIKKVTSGPSTPYDYYGMSYDLVASFRCKCPDVLQEWVQRPRKYDWPSQELKLQVVELGANLVPTGCGGDAYHDKEWRFCFNPGEIQLVHSWNDTQAKLYILLKIILKDFLKPESKEITSYAMKNIVFWLAESKPQASFSPDSLIRWAHKALKLLSQSIRRGYLPYYMIPTRNLFEDKLAKACTTKLTEKLSVLVRMGPKLIIVSRKVRFGLRLWQSQQIQSWAFKRMVVEFLHLKFNSMVGMDGTSDGSFLQVLPEQLYMLIAAVLCPDREQLQKDGYNITEVVFSRFNELLQ